MAIAVNAANTADTSRILRRVYVHQLYTEIDSSAAILPRWWSVQKKNDGTVSGITRRDVNRNRKINGFHFSGYFCFQTGTQVGLLFITRVSYTNARYCYRQNSFGPTVETTVLLLLSRYSH